jgi:AcrR family transcriptional regulator
VPAERGHSTRERLLAAAASLVAEVGWGGVTTRLVAERAGVNAGVVHYHFSSVTDLLVAACSAVAEDMLDQIVRDLARQPDVASGVDWLLGELARFSGTDPTSLLLVEAFLAASRVPEMRARLGSAVVEFRAGVTTWLEAIGSGAEAERAAVVLAAVLDGLALHRGLDPALDLAAAAGPLRRMLAPSARRTAT